MTTASETLITYESTHPETYADQCVCFGMFEGGNICTNPFTITFYCDYDEDVTTNPTTQIISETEIQLNFGDVRHQISPYDGCFSEIGDDHYFNCNTNPTPCANQNQF